MYVYPTCFTNLALLLNTDMDATKTINEIKQKSVLTNDTLNLVLQKKSSHIGDYSPQYRSFF